MRICVLVHQFPVRSETFIVDHARALIDRGHEVVIVPFTPRPTVAWDYPSSVADAVSATKPSNGGPASLPRAMRLARDETMSAPGSRKRRVQLARRVAGSGPFDLVHAQFATTMSAAVALVRHGVVDAPIVCSVHGQDVNVTAQANPAAFAAAAQHVQAMTVGTSFMRRVVIDLGAPPERLHLWPQGIDVDGITPRAAIERDGMRVVSVGRLVEFKGVDDSLRVIAAARVHVPGLRYTVVGDGPLRSELERLADDLGISDITTFAGARDHAGVLDALRDADVYLQMGKVGADGSREGQGVAPGEAAATGLPCVVTRAGGLPEMVRDGQTGTILDIGDITGGAGALARLSADRTERERRGANGRAFISAEYSRAASIDRIESIYRDVIGK